MYVFIGYIVLWLPSIADFGITPWNLDMMDKMVANIVDIFKYIFV